MKTFKLVLLPSAILASSCETPDINKLSGVAKLGCKTTTTTKNGKQTSITECEKTCHPGYSSQGRKKVRCKNGQWKGVKPGENSMQGCITCQQSPSADSSVTKKCEINEKKKHICTYHCNSGEKIFQNKKKYVMRCRCPKNDKGIRECNWYARRAVFHNDEFNGLRCGQTQAPTDAPEVPEESDPEDESENEEESEGESEVESEEESEDEIEEENEPEGQSVQANLDAKCVQMAKEGRGGCNKVKYARYNDFKWSCVESLYDRKSLDCVDEQGELVLCRATDVKGQSCDLDVQVPQPQREKTQFMKDCLAKYEKIDKYKNVADDLCGVIDEMNVWRRQYGVKDFVVPNQEYCDDAQAYAEILAASEDQKLKHASFKDRKGQGENLAMGTNLTMMRGAQMWQAEEKWWDQEKAECVDMGENDSCLHFTANVWKSTTQACVGIAQSKKNPRNYFVVGRYFPHPNYNNQFAENVLPDKDSEWYS